MADEAPQSKRAAERDDAPSETPAKRQRVETVADSKRTELSDAVAGTSSPGATPRDFDSPSNRPGQAKGRQSKRGKARQPRGRGGTKPKQATDKPNADSNENQDVQSQREGSDSPEKKDRLPKRKVAVLVGYNGTGYLGSQINPGTSTIEGECWQAFIKSGAVSDDNANSHAKVGLCRAARTDAGVHAAVNVLCLKLITSPISLEPGKSIEEHVNSFLPPQLRVWSIIRVQGGFEPRKLCDQRHYQYTLPTSVFLGPKPSTERGKTVAKSREAYAGQDDQSPAIWAESDKFWASRPADSTIVDDEEAKKSWRITPAILQDVKDFVDQYRGSHNFYNYTVGKDFRDRSCQRMMRSLEVKDPFVVNDIEYISVHFVGQSFMLHQIRKMIGLLVLSIRTGTPASLVPETYGPSRIHIPKAPGSGLMLVEPQYDVHNRHLDDWNKRLDSLVEKGQIPESDAAEQRRDPVRLPADKAEQVEQFKRDWVYAKMYETDLDKSPFVKFLSYFDAYTGRDFDYLNPKGVIPQSAVFKSGENAERARKSASKQGEGVEAAQEVPEPYSDDEASRPPGVALEDE